MQGLEVPVGKVEETDDAVEESIDTPSMQYPPSYADPSSLT